ncbi:hypothetical protein [Actinosynnema sp.]|uniref:hypothetical protein n=1 Tax=Actinosynnema sp. TaxID=1872144 RepID=UPI003F866AED
MSARTGELLGVDLEDCFVFQNGRLYPCEVWSRARIGVASRAHDAASGKPVEWTRRFRGEVEPLFRLGVVRLTGAGPEPVPDADLHAGLLAGDADERLVLVRRPDVPYPDVPEVADTPVLPQALAEAEAAVLAGAPEGWRELVLGCRFFRAQAEFRGEVVLADGSTRSWTPPALVAQWLHRLRMTDHRTAWDWRFTPGAEVVREGRSEPPAPERPGNNRCELIGPVGVFDGHAPRWYRPPVGEAELEAVLGYLRGAPVVLEAGGFVEDLVAEQTGGSRETEVPLTHHTDGVLTWTSAVPYFLERHGVPPHPALVRRMRERDYAVGGVSEFGLRRGEVFAGDDLAPGFREGRTAWASLQKALAPVRGFLEGHGLALEDTESTGWVVEVAPYDGYLVKPHGSATGEEFDSAEHAAMYLLGRLCAELGAPAAPAPVAAAPVAAAPPPAAPLLPAQHSQPLPVQHPHSQPLPVQQAQPAQQSLPLPVPPPGVRTPPPWQAQPPAPQEGQWRPGPHTVTTSNGPTHPKHPGMPPVTPELLAAQRANRQPYVRCVDPAVNHPRFAGAVPDWAVYGAYLANPATGELTGEAVLNSEYRPSPRHLGFPEPRTELEAVLGLVTAGWLPGAAAGDAALRAKLFVVMRGPDELPVMVSTAGARLMEVYTSRERFLEGVRRTADGRPQDHVGVFEEEQLVEVDAHALLPSIHNVVLVVNPRTGLTTRVAGSALVAAANRPVFR